MWPDLGVDAVRGLSGAWERLTRDKWGWEGGLIMDKKYGRKSGSGNMHGNIFFWPIGRFTSKWDNTYFYSMLHIEYRDCWSESIYVCVLPGKKHSCAQFSPKNGTVVSLVVVKWLEKRSEVLCDLEHFEVCMKGLLALNSLTVQRLMSVLKLI